MGWLRYMFLGDLGQQMDLSQQADEIRRLRREMRTRPMSNTNINALQEENEQLKLYIAALSRLMMSKGLITHSELAAMIDAVDAEDGKQDGKMKGPLSGGA